MGLNLTDQTTFQEGWVKSQLPTWVSLPLPLTILSKVGTTLSVSVLRHRAMACSWIGKFSTQAGSHSNFFYRYRPIPKKFLLFPGGRKVSFRRCISWAL